MELKVRDVARLLNVSEQTVYRWVKSGSLPAKRIHDQYLFNRVELQEWAASQKHPVSLDLFKRNGSTEVIPSLADALERGGIYHGIPGDRRETVLEAVTRLPGIPESVDRALLHQLLVGREALASTALGDGIAIPHPRDPLVVHVTEPYVLLCFLKQPIDFHAMDGLPVRVLFTLLSPSVRQHLQMLGRLSFALHDPALKELLGRAAPKVEVLDRIRVIESTTGTGAIGTAPGNSGRTQ
ncbi:MAG: PTS sugar transporter subunit IIA [candidate division Zixibacteria bacterium]|nr:PTS sugar transporter subunit IIA [candidate division Zixibacteria bacterium]